MISKWVGGGSEGGHEVFFWFYCVQILMILSAIEIIFMFKNIDLGSISPFPYLKSQFIVLFF